MGLNLRLIARILHKTVIYMSKLFTPAHSYEIIDEKEYSVKIKEVENLLKNYVTKNHFESYDGKKIAYEYYLCENADKTVVFSHGFTEFPDKYHEQFYYFLNMGYNVFILTHRGHGYSYRATDNLQTTHIDSFNQYEKDFSQFIEKVVKKTVSTPLYLYAHSMGGAIAIMYMQKHPDVFKKALLSAPMIRPVSKGASYPVARATAAFMCAFKGPKKKFFTGKEFDPNAKFQNGGSTSECRFLKNLQSRIDDDNYKTSYGSNKWIYESLSWQNRLLSKRKNSKIQTEVLVCVAKLDTVVLTEPQKMIPSRIKNCKLIEFDGAKHEIYSSTNDVLTRYFKTVFDFLR